jgi:hypothetical protein
MRAGHCLSVRARLIITMRFRSEEPPDIEITAETRFYFTLPA